MKPQYKVETMDDIRPGHADEATLAKWFGQIASALDYIHEKGIVHRDVKPSNLLIDEFGSVVLTDFGISRYVDDELKKKLDVEPQNVANARKTATTQFILGTRAYMAPEVKNGVVATAAAETRRVAHEERGSFQRIPSFSDIMRK